MLGERGHVIYVGKAKDLRARLRSYTHVNAENASRKVLRLVHFAQKIEWEVLPDEQAALLRENQLLRALQPEFNVVNTSPQTYLFVHLRHDAEGFRVHLAMSVDESYPHRYGAFKGLGRVFQMHKALLRLFWMSFEEVRHGFELPGRLTNHRKLVHPLVLLPESMEAPTRAALFRKVQRFFRGTSKALLVDLAERILLREDLAPFTRELVQQDLSTLLEFYEQGARRNRRICRVFSLADDWIAQEEVDDWIVKLGHR